MKRNFSPKFIWILSLIFMFLWLASNGCKGRTADSTLEQPPSEQPPSAQINVSSRHIANGNVVLNNISDQSISIQNTGSGTLTIGQIAQADPLVPPFSIVSDTCSGQGVQPSAACSFNVRFDPTSQGTFTDSFDIPSDASNENSVTVDVTGSGKALRVAINQVNITSCSTGTGVLELIVNVTDQNNTFLPGLTTGDFQLKENGVSQAIEPVSQVTTTVPMSVAMVLDYSGSVQNLLSTIEAASINFIGDLNPDDEASIIKFAQMQQQMCSFTSDTSVLTTAITTTPSQIGIDETFLFDALWFAVDKTAVRLKHKAIVLVSDGYDENSQGVPNSSVKTLDEVIAYATANDVTIYTVGLGVNVAGGVMNRLASETGGQYYYITTADQLSGVYQAISDILLGQYSVKYVSSLQGSSPIMLEIDVVNGAAEGTGTSQAVGCP